MISRLKSVATNVTVVLAISTSPAVAQISDPQSFLSQSDIKDYQTLIAALCTFTIGIFTVIIALTSIINSNLKYKRDRIKEKIDKNEKLMAYFSVLGAEISYAIQSLDKSKVILSSEFEGVSVINWLYIVKSARNVIRFETLTKDWERISIIGPENISRLRIFDLSMIDLERAFDHALAMGDMSSLPLFERLGRDDDDDRLTMATDSLVDHIDETLKAARYLYGVSQKTFEGVSNGLGVAGKVSNSD